MSVVRLAMAYAVLVLAAMSVIVVSSQSIVRLAAGPVTRLLQLSDGPATATAGVETRAAVLEGDSWMQNLRSKFQERDRSEYRRAKLGAPSDAPSKGLFGLPLGAIEPRRDDDGQGNSSRSGRGGTYRTMCVRLCDGYFYPVSFATSSDRFDDDQKACQQSCSSPAQLYTYRNPGEEPEDMVSLKGQPYSKLPTAFQFRTKLDLSCKCQPHPWEAEAMDRHRRYAADEAKRRALRQAEHDAKPARNTKGRSKGADASPRSTPDAAPTKAAEAPVAPTPNAPRIALLNAAAATTSDAPGPTLALSTVATAAAAEPMELRLPSATPSSNKSSVRQPKLGVRAASTSAGAAAKSRPTSPAGPPMRLGATPPPRVAVATAASNWRMKAFESR